jgi:hypothetical protein
MLIVTNSTSCLGSMEEAPLRSEAPKRVRLASGMLMNLVHEERQQNSQRQRTPLMTSTFAYRFVCHALTIGEFFNLDMTCRGARDFGQVLRKERYWSRRVYEGLVVRGCSPLVLHSVRRAHGFVSGSIILQVLTGKVWNPTDIDIFVGNFHTLKTPGRRSDRVLDWSLDCRKDFPDRAPAAELLRVIDSLTSSSDDLDQEGPESERCAETLDRQLTQMVSREHKQTGEYFVSETFRDTAFYGNGILAETVRTFIPKGGAHVMSAGLQLTLQEAKMPFQVISVALPAGRSLEQHIEASFDLDICKTVFDGHNLTVMCKQALASGHAVFQCSTLTPEATLLADGILSTIYRPLPWVACEAQRWSDVRRFTASEAPSESKTSSVGEDNDGGPVLVRVTRRQRRPRADVATIAREIREDRLQSVLTSHERSRVLKYLDRGFTISLLLKPSSATELARMQRQHSQFIHEQRFRDKYQV